MLVRWQDSDFQNSERVTSWRYSTPPPTPGPGATGPPANPEQSETGQSNGLSTVQRIGIGVGVGSGVAFLALLLGFFIVLRRQRAGGGLSRHRHGNDLGELPEDTAAKVELPVDAAAAELKGDDAAMTVVPAAPAGPLTVSSVRTSTLAKVLSVNVEPQELDATPAPSRDSLPKFPSVSPFPKESHTSLSPIDAAFGTTPREVSPTTPDAYSQNPTHISEEETSRAVEEAKSRVEQREALEETMRLLAKERTLRLEQDAVRRRLAELGKYPDGEV